MMQLKVLAVGAVLLTCGSGAMAQNLVAPGGNPALVAPGGFASQPRAIQAQLVSSAHSWRSERPIDGACGGLWTWFSTESCVAAGDEDGRTAR